MERPKRKRIRLQEYDYNTPGYYFVTICTRDKEKLLCEIQGEEGTCRFKPYGVIADRKLSEMATFYEDICLEKYVIMPNHVHLLLHMDGIFPPSEGAKSHTQNRVSRFVGTFKRMVNRLCGENIWQYRSHDHVIRGQKDYVKIWEYIENNPRKWMLDCFYTE